MRKAIEFLTNGNWDSIQHQSQQPYYDEETNTYDGNTTILKKALEIAYIEGQFNRCHIEMNVIRTGDDYYTARLTHISSEISVERDVPDDADYLQVRAELKEQLLDKVIKHKLTNKG